ncbi:MAG TPA: DUF3179 domain-containing (seleno)protein [Thermoanaerobaculia bacterium]|nr:DUF3179 domain-containing (seleno)protein [Thermoanaerobaculia bacterium]
MRGRTPLVALSLASAFASACLTSGYRTKPRVAIVDGDPVVQMARAEQFRSATNPRWSDADQHTDPPSGHERLLGLEIHGVRLAYPIGLLDRAEVVNDGIDGSRWVAARCALTHVAAVYDRSLDGRVLTFENSGALWRDTLVLRDVETGTYWTAATGVALSGPLVGKRLRALPAAYTTAKAWRGAFPDSRWVDLGLPTSVPLPMKLYGASPWQGVSHEKAADRRHPPKKEFLSVAVGREALAFTRGDIHRRRSAEAKVGGESVRVEWDPRIDTARAWVLEPSGRREVPVTPMYWFALDRHFDEIALLPTSRETR